MFTGKPLSLEACLPLQVYRKQKKSQKHFFTLYRTLAIKKTLKENERKN